MLISKYFTIEEMIRSHTAVRLDLDNTPSMSVISNIKNLCLNCLDKIREALGKPIQVSSGYRGERLNEKIGGAKNSQHIKGEAADIHCEGMTVESLYQFIKGSGFEYDQLIQEFDSWVHVSFSSQKNRKQNLYAKKLNGRTIYTIDYRQ